MAGVWSGDENTENASVSSDVDGCDLVQTQSLILKWRFVQIIENVFLFSFFLDQQVPRQLE